MSDRITFGLMRLVRAVAGAYAAAGLVSVLMTIIQLLAGNVGASALILAGALFAFGLAVFVAMRAWINAEHRRRHGVPHPRMTRFAAF